MKKNRSYLVTFLFLTLVVGFWACSNEQEENLNKEDSVQKELKVTGGSEISITSAPWQVLLEVNGSYECGGSIIGDKWVLTAKHCTANNPQINVIFGVTSKSEITSLNKISVKRIINHPTADISILELNSPIPLSSKSQIISIPTNAQMQLITTGSLAKVSGWGWLTPNGANSATILNSVNVYTMTNAAASTAIGETLYDWEIGTTGVGSVRQGACHGDSGGPLVSWINNNPYLIGVVSWGRPACVGNNTNSPSIYVRSSYFLDWIILNTGIITMSANNAFACVNENVVYTLSENTSPNAIINWQGVQNATLVSGQGTRNATFKVSGSNYAIVKAVITEINSVTIQNSEVRIGTAPPMPVVYNSYELDPQYVENEFYSFATDINPGDVVSWLVGGNAKLMGKSDGTNFSSISVKTGAASQSNSFTIRATVTNRCGVSPTSNLDITFSSSGFGILW